MCRNRAEAHRLFAHPEAMRRLVDDPLCVSGGATAAPNYGADLVVQGEADVYAAAKSLDRLVRRYGLTNADKPNVVVRVPRDIWPFSDGETIASAAIAAVDLMDTPDDRSVRAGIALLTTILKSVPP